MFKQYHYLNMKISNKIRLFYYFKYLVIISCLILTEGCNQEIQVENEAKGWPRDWKILDTEHVTISDFSDQLTLDSGTTSYCNDFIETINEYSDLDFKIDVLLGTKLFSIKFKCKGDTYYELRVVHLLGSCSLYKVISGKSNELIEKIGMDGFQKGYLEKNRYRIILNGNTTIIYINNILFFKFDDPLQIEKGKIRLRAESNILDRTYVTIPVLPVIK